jgi:AraC family transcriptional regulator
MITREIELALAQEDGNLPTTIVAGSAPGESGVSIRFVRFRDGLHLSGTVQQHFICFQLAQACFDCRIGGRSLRHEPPAGSLAICPAGIDCAADAKGSVDAVLIAVDPRHLALAAAEDSALEAQLMERLAGSDQELLNLAHALVAECRRNFPNGPLLWNELADAFTDGLVARHTSRPPLQARGKLGKEVLARLRDYIVSNIGEPIEVAALAKIAGRSPFHFSRVFSRSVGVSPHRYIVHLRLRRALELARSGQVGLAEIAVRTGFADQSHLWRWVRRVHGVSLTQLVSPAAPEQHECS